MPPLLQVGQLWQRLLRVPLLPHWHRAANCRRKNVLMQVRFERLDQVDRRRRHQLAERVNVRNLGRVGDENVADYFVGGVLDFFVRYGKTYLTLVEEVGV